MKGRKQRTVEVLNAKPVRLLRENPAEYYQQYPIPRFGFDVKNASKSNKSRIVKK